MENLVIICKLCDAGGTKSPPPVQLIRVGRPRAEAPHIWPDKCLKTSKKLSKKVLENA